MTPQRYQRIARIFTEARKQPDARREAYVREACGSDVDGAERVMAMLAQHARPAVDLDSPAMGGQLDLGAVAAVAEGLDEREPPPERIGDFRILDVLGEGGMGVVYRAQQERPRRTVALKVLRQGLATPRMLRRFDHESQFLAKLHHPGIAQIYEAAAGGPPGGEGQRPYFAMELVEGRAITDYARARKLSVRQRLALMQRVCEAVHHAHVKGVIHRDLKPANILVNDAGQPKVLDFGVARAADADFVATTLATVDGQLVGTIPYMSPEQIAGDVSGIDARSDVYSLGVILYELLSGELPCDLGGKSLAEAARIVSEHEPAPLSRFDRALRGDLETIVRKALEKSPELRYQSAHDLAADIGRSLRDDPIAARPPTLRYQLTKFARRNRALVTGCAVAGLALLLGLAGATWGWVAAQAQRDDARQARDEARRQARFAQAVNSFLNHDLLALADPHERRGRDDSIRGLLDEASARLEHRFESEPMIKAYILTTLGNTYRRIGDYDAADARLTDALSLADAAGPASLHRLHVIEALVRLREKQGRYDEAEQLARRILDAPSGPFEEDSGLLPRTAILLANVHIAQGRLDDAEELLERTRIDLSGDSRKDHALLLDLKACTARLLQARGRWEEAENALSELVELRTRESGPEHRTTLSSLKSLATVLHRRGKLEEAEALYIQALDIHRRIDGEEHPDALRTAGNLGLLYKESGRYDQAELLLRDALDRQTATLGPDHPERLSTLSMLAAVYIDSERPDAAEPLLLEAVDRQTRVLGATHTKTVSSLGNLAAVYLARGDLDAAEPLARRVVDAYRETYGPEHPSTLRAAYNLATLYERRGEFEAAVPVYERLVAAARRSLRPGHWHIGVYLGGLGRCYVETDRWQEAQTALLESYDVLDAALQDGHVFTAATVESLIDLYERRNQAAEAERWRGRLARDSEQAATSGAAGQSP